MSCLRLVRHTTAASFLDRAQRFLVGAEAENVLLIGLAGALSQHDATGPTGDTVHLLTVEGDSGCVMAALQSPERNLVMSRGPAAAIEALAEGLAEAKVCLPGVHGPVDAARGFAGRWAKGAGLAVQLAMSMRVYQLTRVIPPPLPPGRFRAATPADIPVLARWADSFITETGVDDSRSRKTIVEGMVEEGQLHVWDHQGPASMAGYGGETPRGVRVSLVYTPPDLRSRGYASACVASLSQLLLDSGRAFCALYTDLANPISNRLYRRIGYEPVADVAEHEFHEAHEDFRR
jgi:GNAT superfamily N-acetyltransferase